MNNLTGLKAGRPNLKPIWRTVNQKVGQKAGVHGQKSRSIHALDGLPPHACGEQSFFPTKATERNTIWE